MPLEVIPEGLRSSIHIIVRRGISAILPDSLLQIVRRQYYARIFKAVTVSFDADLALLRRFVRPGEFVVDIGANLGSYTKLLSEWVGVDGHVYSIEPVPLTFDVLCSNIRKLGLRNVDAIKCAISDIDGFGVMEVPLYESGGENFYRATLVEEHTESSLRRMRIQTKTIDSLLPKGVRVSFIKCDVEGHELRCVKGAINTIRSSKPAWLIEIKGDPENQGGSAYDIFKLLSEHGYGAYWFDRSNLIKRRPGDRSLNYWFLTPEHVAKLHERGLVVADC